MQQPSVGAPSKNIRVKPNIGNLISESRCVNVIEDGETFLSLEMAIPYQAL